KLVNSAFAEFPIVGGQIHEQLGVETFSATTLSLLIGVFGAIYGGRGFAHALQHTLNTVWAVPKVDRPGFAPRYLRTLALLLLLNIAGIIVAHRLRHAQAVAGLFGVVLGLLAWLALQATVNVYAMEVDAVREKHLWPRSLVQPPLTEADKSYYTSAVRAEAQRPELRLKIDYDIEQKPTAHPT